MKIVIAGIGFVGQALSLLLARKNFVVAIDVLQEKADIINNRNFPNDVYVNEYISNNKLNLIATTSPKEAYTDADIVFIATPTDYIEETNCFDTSSITKTIDLVKQYNNQAIIVVKSTVPIGFMKSICKRYNRLLYCPEFLKEDTGLNDCLYPSRIVIGCDLNNVQSSNDSAVVAKILIDSSYKKETPVLCVGYKEAEAIKLFANTYLAMRIGFFNELDTFSEMHEIDARKVIEGVCLDSRIGMYYNNPSFGFGGYCLPKDTKQLLKNYEGIPQTLINSIVQTNLVRKNHIINRIQAKISDNDKKIVGVYRLTTKASSSNIRHNCMKHIITKLILKGNSIIIYEPLLNDGEYYYGGTVINNLAEFKMRSDVIIANRCDIYIKDVAYKVYSRDIFNEN